jgi:hypothetical protein
MTELDDRPTAGAPTLVLFTATMFTGAALLFWVQPLFAKMVLPLLGGSPQVWNTALVFFQAELLAGYAYAHWLTRALAPLAQMGLHAGVLALAALFLPLAVAAGWEPDPAGVPVVWLLARSAPPSGCRSLRSRPRRRCCSAGSCAPGMLTPTIRISCMAPAISAASLPCSAIRYCSNLRCRGRRKAWPGRWGMACWRCWC